MHGMSRKKGKEIGQRIDVDTLPDDFCANYSEFEEDGTELHVEKKGLFTLDVTDMGQFCFSDATLTVKGLQADEDDFGEMEDIERANAPQFCCGNMMFVVYDPPPEGVLEKYGLSMDEYKEICYWLQKCLSIGFCDWCR